ncbi:MAG: hypothetical protein K2P85_00335 [Flavobacteriaceae bacterium]|nr:hypothetical protein [Flavobacteriaceae bacterium]
MKKVIIFLMAVGSLLTVSCESNTYGEVSVVTNPTYRDNIGPLFTAKCTGCHKNGDQLPDLQTYDEVKDAIVNGNVICLIDNPGECFFSGYMPPTGRMQQTTIDMVKLWKDQGFVN